MDVEFSKDDQQMTQEKLVETVGKILSNWDLEAVAVRKEAGGRGEGETILYCMHTGCDTKKTPLFQNW